MDKTKKTFQKWVETECRIGGDDMGQDRMEIPRTTGGFEWRICRF